jgi:hypothetical protein
LNWWKESRYGRRLASRGAGLCAIAAALVPAIASAQTYGPVAAAGEYAPKGMPLGGFVLYPSLDLGTGYDDNVFLTEKNTQSSFFFTEAPRFDLKSNWNRHELDFYGQMNAFQYTSLGDEDHIDGIFGGSGRVDVMRGLDVTGGASYSILHLANSSPLLAAIPTSPTQYSESLANVAVNYHPYHFGVSLGINFSRTDFDSTQLGIAPFNISNKDLDENLYNPFVKFSYEFRPGYSVFVRGDYNTQQFDQAVDRNGQRMDSNGETANAGLEMKITHLVTGQVFVGYLNQNYEAPLVSVSGPDYGVNVDWSPSVFWTFHLLGSRTLNATIVPGASTEDDNQIRFGVDYAILRDVTIQAHASYWDATFPGASRNDQYPEGGLGVTYFMNKHVSVTGSYDYLERESNVPGQNFTDNRVMLGVNLHM